MESFNERVRGLVRAAAVSLGGGVVVVSLYARSLSFESVVLMLF